MAEQKEGGEAAAPAAGKRKLLILGGAGVLVLALGGGAAWWFLGRAPEPPAEEVAAPPPAPVTLYATLVQRMSVAIDVEGKPRYVQIGVSAMAREQPVIDALGVHQPLLQSRISSILTTQDFEALRTEQGKEALRAAILQMVQEVLEAEKAKGIEQVYFTEFVLQ
ncbi:MAG: flagellar basal body-associated protein FliL [Gammaproteobacteria bacterium]